MVAVAVPVPTRMVTGTVMIPVIVPVVPLVSVMVNGAVNLARSRIALMVPLPMPPDRLAVPVKEAVVVPMVPVAFTVNVVLMVAASAAAQASRATVKLTSFRVIGSVIFSLI
jgi:hypothetical protein